MSMNKRMAVNLIANFTAFAIQFGINLFLTPYIVNSLGSEAYSFIPLTNNIIGYVTIINVAFYSMTGRFISVALNQDDAKRANIYFTSSTIANCVLTVFLLIPSFCLVFFAEKLIVIPSYLVQDVKLTLVFALCSMNISMALASFGSVYFVKNRVDISARRNIEGNIIRVVVLVSLFAFLKPKIYFINATMLIVTIYSCCANVYYTRKLLPEIHLRKTNFRLSAVKTLLSSGIWNSVNELSTVLLTTLDLLLANLLAGSVASGSYSVAKTVPNFVQSIISTLVAVFVPQLTIYFAKNKIESLVKDIDFSVRLIGFISAIPIGFLLAAGEVFFRLWVPTQDAHLLHGLSCITLVALAITSCTSLTNNVFTVTNKLKVPSLVLLAFGVANTICVIGLMKYTPLGIWAIPIAALCVGILRSLIFNPMYAARCLNVDRGIFYPSIAKGISCTLVMFAVTVAYMQVLPTGNWALLTLCGVICTIISSFLCLYIVFNKEERDRVIGLVSKQIKSRIKK